MKLAVIRIRGEVRIVTEVHDTLEMLRLNKKNNCVIVEDTPSVMGMLRFVESFITWGPVDEKTLVELKKKGEKVMKLSCPRKGYGRKGIKMPYKLHGAYGNREEKINDLLTRMM